jgi:hypothetical protein
MALKLKFKPDVETWQRHPYIVSWCDETVDHDGEIELRYVGLTQKHEQAMAEFLSDYNIGFSKYMVKEAYKGYGPYSYVHCGFRFLTEEDATIFWLRFQGE